MNIAAAGAAPGPALLKALVPDRKTVRSDAVTALSSAVLAAPEQAKSTARAHVQAVLERLKVLKKLFAGDPKAMAKALAQAFKELKGALEDFRQAGGQELGMASDAANAGVRATGPSPAQDQPSDKSAPTPDRSLYEAVAGEVRKSVGEDGLSFVRDLRALSNEISDLLERARTQAAGRKPDKDTKDAFEDADKSLKDLRKALVDTEQDIHTAVPAAGLRLSIEA